MSYEVTGGDQSDGQMGDGSDLISHARNTGPAYHAAVVQMNDGIQAGSTRTTPIELAPTAP